MTLKRRSTAASSDPLADELVLGAALRSIQAAQEIVEWYAGPSAPIRTDQLADLSRGAGCRVAFYRFESDLAAVALPPLRGVYPIFINDAAPHTDRLFAWRHEIGHVLQGDVEEATYLVDGDAGFMSHSERVADLFALSDLVPGWWLATQFERGRTTWREILREIRAAVSACAEDWPDERLDDRAALRLRLYRESAI